MPELPETAKSAHSEVNYGPGTKREHCGVCVHFIAPRRCESVKSPVSAEAWCMRFERERTARAA
jgi:hypothetical protein